MSATFKRIRELVREGKTRISVHGYDELAADGILAMDLVNSIDDAVLVEDYPEYDKGACILVRQADASGAWVHAVWGIPRGEDEPAVLVTAYRPDPDRWSDDCLRRVK